MKRLTMGMCVLVLLLTGAMPALGDDYSVAGIDNPALVTRFLATLQRAVSAGDRKAVAALVRFPIRAKLGSQVRPVKDAAAFLKNYNAIVNESVRDAILKQAPGQLFVNYQGVMIGNGQVWFGLVGRDVRVIAINN